MIYLVTTNSTFDNNSNWTVIPVEKSLEIMKSWKLYQYDSETSGRDSRICKLLCAQFGNDTSDTRIVVDCSTIDIKLYKSFMESHLMVGQNLKFDLQFLYNEGIIVRNVYDTMIVEQFLHLGYPPFPKPGGISYALNAIALRYLGVDIDKTVRGEIIWRGLDENVILYAAGDVTYLEQIMWKQTAKCKEKNCLVGAKIECYFVPVIAYLEWCGIKLDSEKWINKMKHDQENLAKRKTFLDNLIAKYSEEGYGSLSPKVFQEYVFINYQGDLFDGFDLTPKCLINWSSQKQVLPLFQLFGFTTTIKDKKTGEDKNSVLEKVLKGQRGLNDEFLDAYFDYQESAKVVSTYGQGHLDCINPITGRIHTTYKQLGAASGRMSCGSQQPNEDLAKIKHIAPSRCKYPNIQQLPSDEETRSCFVAEAGNKFCSCDYSAIESRLGGDIYQDQAILDEFLLRSGDMHSLVAKMIFPELKDVPIEDIKKQYPELRKRAKPVEFSQQFDKIL